MEMFQGSVSDQVQSPIKDESSRDASQSFQEELLGLDQSRNPYMDTNSYQDTNPDIPETPQDRRARDLVTSLSAPNLDWGKMTDKLRYTFVDEKDENGLPGMHSLADKVSRGIGRPVSVEPFRSGSRVFAIYINDPNGRLSEIPITGRGSPQVPSNPFPYYPSPYDPSVPPISPYEPYPTVPTLPPDPGSSTSPWRPSPFDPPSAPPLFPKQTIPNPLEKDQVSTSSSSSDSTGSQANPWLPSSTAGSDSSWRASPFDPPTAPPLFPRQTIPNPLEKNQDQAMLEEGRRSRGGAPHYEDPHTSTDSPYYEDPGSGASPYYEDPGSGGSPYYEDPGSGGSPYYEDPGSNDTPYSP